MMRHDLKTALDILELPNYIKTSAYVRRNESLPLRNLDKLDLNADSVIRLERRVNVCYVRACVLKLDDADWFALKKGSDFVHDHAHHVGSEILLPLECRMKVRLLDRNGGKLYRTIREVCRIFICYWWNNIVTGILIWMGDKCHFCLCWWRLTPFLWWYKCFLTRAMNLFVSYN